MKLAQPRVARPNWYDTRPFADLPRAHPRQMQMLFDLLPVVFFFIAYKMAGIYVATAVLIDATIIRGVLAPAAVAMLGRWNWWLPAWAAWLLRVEPSEVTQSAEPDAVTQAA